MPIVIKEIHVITTIERSARQDRIPMETIQRIKYDILREIQKNTVVVQRKRKER